MQLTRRITNHAGDLFSEFDRLFRNTVARTSGASPLPREFSLYETDNSWILRADLPGFRKEDLKIEFSEGVLTIDAKSERDEALTEFKEALRLPKGVQVDGINARLEHGVLELVLPKSAPEGPESIRINVN